MTDPLFGIDITVKPDFGDLSTKLRKAMIMATIDAHEKTLRDITGIMSYTATGNPAQPSGSTYRRTFGLLQSYKSSILRNTPPVIISTWQATKRYARYVIGRNQASVHRNRWESIPTLTPRVEILQRENLVREYKRREILD